MIVHDSWWSNKNVFQLTSTITTIIDYHVPLEQGFIKTAQMHCGSEVIHTPPMEGHWKFLGVEELKSQMFKRKV